MFVIYFVILFYLCFMVTFCGDKICKDISLNKTMS